MVAVHFTTIFCEPNTLNRHKESQMFGEISPSTHTIVYATVLEHSCYERIKGFAHAKNHA